MVCHSVVHINCRSYLFSDKHPGKGGRPKGRKPKGGKPKGGDGAGGKQLDKGATARTRFVEVKLHA